MCTTFNILLLLSPLLISLSYSQPRRVLHQPLFPTISISPTQPPVSSPQPQPQPKQQQQPKLPFSSSSSSPSSSSPPQKPFFPSSYHSPPLPPSPTVVATFPANISSLLLPHPYTRHHRPAVALAASLSLLSLAFLLAAAFFVHHRRRRRHALSSAADNDDDKASRSDSLRLFPPNTATSDGGDRKPRRKSSPRSELLYLGTVANSENTTARAIDSSCSNNDGFRPPYQKLGDSPELNPLPPLPRYNLRAWEREEEEDKKNKEEGKEEEEEEFFSPRGSSGNKQQSPPLSPSALLVASSSRMFHVDKFGSRSFTSRTPSYPLSNSASSSPSPTSIKSLPPHNPASPSFSSSSSSPKLSEQWDVLGQSKNSPATKLPPSPPPPPPPPPPPQFWETPVAVAAKMGEGVAVRNENEETPKPKLKALHWDKVKASSDRLMVWDRLRPSSFQ